MREKLRFLGMGVHAETIAVAVAEPNGEVRSLGTIANREDSIRKFIKRLGLPGQLRACYEAGPTGFVLYWQLAQMGVECAVTAAGILAVEAYHAGLIRTTINYLDPTGATIGGYTNLISALRASLSQAGLLGVAPSAYDANPDDFGLATFSVSLGGASETATRITNADATNVIAFARNTTQVLNIVTGGGAVNGTAAVSPAVGVFFPAGMNAGPNGFK